MTVWRPPPPSARLGDWDYIATYVATSTPDGIVGEWVDGLPGPDVRAAVAEFAARSRGAFREGRHIETADYPKVALEDLFDFAASSA
jgi:hypothetical protein